MSDYGRLQEENGQLKAEVERLTAEVAELKEELAAAQSPIARPVDTSDHAHLLVPEGNEQSDA